MEIGQLKNIIANQSEDIEAQKNDLIMRDVEMEQVRTYLSYPNILIITGIRRCGKSTLSILILDDKKFAYINFDDNELIGFTNSDFNKLLQACYELYGSDLEYFIFDEIQNISGWELFVSKLRKTKKIIVTGSNANLLSMELSTHLTGRHIDYYLTTFSFSEYLKLKKFKWTANDLFLTKKKAELNLHLQSYIDLGGFPEVYKFGKVMSDNIFDDIVNKDILVRHQIKHKAEFKKVAGYLSANYGQEFTYNKLKNIFEIKNVQTLKNYIEYLRESYLVFVVERFSYKIKQQIIAPKKIYVADNSFSGGSLEFSENIGKKIENLVFLELMRRGAQDKKENIFYWHDHRDREVDFVIKRDKKVEQLIQVSYSLANSKTREREIKSLLLGSEQLKCDNLTIVTMEDDSEEIVDGKKIKIVSLVNFLLSKDL